LVTPKNNNSLRLPNQTFREKWYPINLCIAQLILVRIAIAWNHGEATILSYYAGTRWHLMALTLLGSLVTGVQNAYRLEQTHVIDVNSTAKIIQNIVKLALVLITVLNSVLVIVYKIRSENATDVPGIYQGLLEWELVQPLDQVQLGRLIFNYGGAGLFVLAGLFYVTKRASLMIMGDASLPGKIPSNELISRFFNHFLSVL
jgi:ethanolaminephosphotransferase